MEALGHGVIMGRCRNAALLAAVLAAGVFLRRVAQRSGVTDDEANASLPGDELLPHAMVEWTRGITIDATAQQIWPWLVQMGYGRAGWYTNVDVDRIVWRTNAGNSDEILPRYQDLTVGDVVPDGPDHAAYFWVRRFDPNHAIVYHSIRHPYLGHPIDASDRANLHTLEQDLIDAGTYLDFSWAFVLRPNGRAGTRLLIRTRVDYAPKRLSIVQVPLGLVDAYHAHTILRGIRERAEAHAYRTVGCERHPVSIRAQARTDNRRSLGGWISSGSISGLPRCTGGGSGSSRSRPPPGPPGW